MYVKKEIREFIEKMPKKEKMTREWKSFIQKSTIKHNLLIEHGKEEYECTHCGKYSYGKLLSDRNYKHYDICRFCGKKYEIRRSNLKNYFFLYDLAIVDNVDNKLVLRYFEVERNYNYKKRRFDWAKENMPLIEDTLKSEFDEYLEYLKSINTEDIHFSNEIDEHECNEAIKRINIKKKVLTHKSHNLAIYK